MIDEKQERLQIAPLMKEQTQTMNFTQIKPSTRTGRNGKMIQCPNCGHIGRVYHLSWSALSCVECDRMIDKYDWAIECKNS